jgi:hypothetical protein
MNTKSLVRNAIAALVATIWIGHAQAATFTLGFTGSAGGFSAGQTDFAGLHFDQFSQGLSGIDPAIVVSQGDFINSTVTFDGLVTIPTSQVRTDLVMFFSGSTFPSINTGVNGTYTFFNGASVVNTFGYGSTTSGGLASFAAVFPPDNGAFSFTSYTNDFEITDLATSATLDRSPSFTYSLVSNVSAVPEPATWAMLLLGFFGIGFMMRDARRKKGAVAVA